MDSISSTVAYIFTIYRRLSLTYGIDHEKLTYLSQRRQFRLTDVGGNVVKEMVA